MARSLLSVLGCAAALLTAPLALADPAVAQQARGGPLMLTLEEGVVRPLPILIAPFDGASGAEIAEIVARDLGHSGVFQPVNPNVGRTAAPNFNAPPLFEQIRSATDARALVTGEAINEGDGKLAIRFRLWDVLSQEQLAGFQYRADPNATRRMAHRVADSIYERLTGEPGYFETRIAFIEESGRGPNVAKRLAVMDYDGANVEYLTSGAELVLTPRYAPSEQAMTYISYREGLPRVYLLNVQTRRQELLGSFKGMSFAPRFSPDGSKVVMSISQNGETKIHEMDVGSRRMRQLTSGRGLDTAPSYSPDGRQIAFESDREGGQQIYVMDSGGGGVRRLSSGPARHATPVWSPRGDYIAFTRMESGRFSIGVMRPDGSGARTLTTSFLEESPTWAPNGRRLMFTRQEGPGSSPQIWEVDIRGGQARRVQTPGAASDPAWGPPMR